MQKNVAGQNFVVFAFDRTTNVPVTGDAANITANIKLDFGSSGATNDTNPTETEDGYYEFTGTQAETNADTIQLLPQSSTADTQVIAVPGIIYTDPSAFADNPMRGTNLSQLAANDVNLPAAPTNFLTAASIAASAMDGKGDWNIGKTGYTLTISAPTAVQNRQEMDSNSVDLNQIVSDVAGLAGSAMRGTDSANTVVPDPAGTAPTAIENRQEMDSNSVDLNQIVSDVAGLAGAAMRGTDSANTVVPDPAGTAPTAVENRQEMDSNSTQLTSISTDTGTTIPALLNDIAITKNTAGVFHVDMVKYDVAGIPVPVTGATVTAQRLIDSGVFVNVTGTIAEVSNGSYIFSYTAADSNGDTITWKFSAATADDTKYELFTVA